MGKAKMAIDLSLKEYEGEKAKIVAAVRDGRTRVQSISKSTKIPQARIIDICEHDDDFIVNVAFRVGGGIADLPRSRWVIEYEPGAWSEGTGDVGR